MLKKILIATLAVGATFAGVSAANAADGCGPGAHRGPYGHCHANRPGPVLVAPGVVIGQFYPGRGYWDGHRYWARREQWHGGWRYH